MRSVPDLKSIVTVTSIRNTNKKLSHYSYKMTLWTGDNRDGQGTFIKQQST